MTSRRFIDVALLALGMTMLSCLLTLMYIFVGGGGGGDAQTLLVMQVWIAPIALLVFLSIVLRQAVSGGIRQGFRDLWHALPAWIVLALILLNSLVLIGELSLYLRARIVARSPMWFEHAPLLCALACSLAFFALYARSSHARSSSQASTGRW